MASTHNNEMTQGLEHSYAPLFESGDELRSVLKWRTHAGAFRKSDLIFLHGGDEEGMLRTLETDEDGVINPFGSHTNLDSIRFEPSAA